MGTFNYGEYLSNLLICQYHGKTRAKATIKAIAKMFPVDLLFAVRDGFSLDTAVGKQLDILAKYLQIDRHYTNSSNQPASLTDSEFRTLLKLKAICNTGTGSCYGIDSALYEFFGIGIRAVETKDTDGNQTMGMTYYIRSDWSNVALAAIQQDALPRPMGVGVGYNLAARTEYFGFIEYADQTHPYTTGFRDYDTPTKDGEMYKYDSVIV